MSTVQSNIDSATSPGSPVAPTTPPVAHSAPNELLPGIKFAKQLNIISGKATTKPEIVRGIASLLKAAGCQALWIVTSEGSAPGSPPQPISLLGDDTAILQAIESSFSAICSLIESNRSLVSVGLSELQGHVLLGAPISTGDETSDMLIGMYPSTSRSPFPAEWALNLAVDAVAKWQMQTFVKATAYQLSSLSSFVNMAAAMNRTESQLEAGITLVNQLKAATQSSQVTLLLRKGRKGPFQLAAMSGVEFFDRNAATTQTIESTILGLNEEPTFWCRKNEANSTESPDSGTTELQINLENYCSAFDSQGCALLPLRDAEDSLFGWLLLSMNGDQCNDENTQKHFRQITTLVSGQLDTVMRAQRTMTRVWVDNGRQALRKNMVKRGAIIAGIALLFLCIPFTYKIPCQCELQLTSRRFVAAPYEGLLEKTMVESGDVVSAGQVLARMDASHLRMKLSGLQADLASEKKKRDSALARGSVAESQIARSEMSRLESEISIAANRLKDTEILAPVAGVIVSGDLEKAEGAPMEMGQNLFEVGPLEKMLVEIRIPENEIQYTKTGMKVRFEFDAFPFETFDGEIKRIHPRAEMIDNESVFVAEIELDNQSRQLRPGLKGKAKIYGNRSPLGWNLFHGAFENARQWLIW